MTKRDYIDFDGPCTDSCRSHGFVMRVSRQSRLVTGSSAMQNYKHSSFVGPASFAWGEKGVWPTSIEALMTAILRHIKYAIFTVALTRSSSQVTATACIPRLLHIFTSSYIKEVKGVLPQKVYCCHQVCGVEHHRYLGTK